MQLGDAVIENGVPLEAAEGVVEVELTGVAEGAAIAPAYGVDVGGSVAVTKNGVALGVAGAEMEILHDVRARIAQSEIKTKIRM